MTRSDKKVKKVLTFEDVRINQTFLFYLNNVPQWYRKQSHITAIREDDNHESVFFPEDVITHRGRTISSLPLDRVRGNNQTVVLLKSNQYWQELSLVDAKLKASTLGLGNMTDCFLIRKNKKG